MGLGAENVQCIEEGDVRRLNIIQSQADISAHKPRDNVQSLSEWVTGRGLCGPAATKTQGRVR